MDWKNKLALSIDKLTEILTYKTSYTYKLMSWLVYWAATAIWATVIAWIVIYILSNVIQELNISQLGWIEQIIDQYWVEDSSEQIPQKNQ